MLDMIKCILKTDKSGVVAKKRLYTVLKQDRAVVPEVMKMLRNDIIQLMSKYMVVDTSDRELAFLARIRRR